ncbi:MAG: peptide deformylase [Bacteroidota bacterium]
MMNLNNILKLGDPRLYQVSEPVHPEELAGLQPQIDALHDLVLQFRAKYSAGRAIAAPQIGLMKRIICLHIDEPITILNPTWTALSEEMIELWDDCMSFPDLFVKVKRHKRGTFTFFDPEWNQITWELSDDMSELMQHEYDHLDGILATQRAIDAQSFRWRGSEGEGNLGDFDLEGDVR